MRSKAWGQHLHFGWAASAGHNPEVRKLQGPAAVTWKLGSPLCRVSGQDTTKSKMGRRKDLLLEVVRVDSYPLGLGVLTKRKKRSFIGGNLDTNLY